MKLYVLAAAIAAVSVLAVSGHAATPPDPLKQLGKPTRAGYVTAGGARWFCQQWERPKRGFFVRRCYFVGRVHSKPAPPGA